MTSRIFEGRGRGMLYDPARIEEPQFDLLDPDWWRPGQDPQGAVAGRGAVWFVNAGDEQWALRHYRRGGLIGKWVSDQFVWVGQDASRPFREFRLLDHLQTLGLPAPVPVAAGYLRSGPCYRADLATVRIPGAVPLSHRLANGCPEPALWRETGRLIRRFHDSGVFHADLNAHNILIDDRGGVHLIDFDRGRLRRGEGWKRSNLDRLRRSLAKISNADSGIAVSPTQWRDLLSGYDDASGSRS